MGTPSNVHPIYYAKSQQFSLTRRISERINSESTATYFREVRPKASQSTRESNILRVRSKIVGSNTILEAPYNN